MIRLLVCSEDAEVRARLSRSVAAEDDIELVGECRDGVEAWSVARRVHPDVVLVDLVMACSRAMGIVERLVTARPGAAVGVVLVTTLDDSEAARDALRHGASGFLARDSSPRLLVAAVRAAASGEALISPTLTVDLLRDLAGRGYDAPVTPAEPLTARELDTVRLVAQGLSNLEIAARLHVSLSTVKNHVSGAQAKLAARNRVELAVWAWETGKAAVPVPGE